MTEHDDEQSEERSDQPRRGSQDFDVHRAVVNLLLEKVRRDPYPSTTMMDLVEELLEPDEVPAYAAVLMEKIERDAFPSVDMLCRVRDLA